MIHVDRLRVDPPEFLAGEKCDGFRAAAAEHFRHADSDSRRFHFDVRRLRYGVDATLEELFYNKCAYCEQPVAEIRKMTKMAPRPGAGAQRNFEHFRPKRGALGMGGEGETPLHYWWLAYEWPNHYLACQTCNTNKRTQFPVAGERAPQETPWEQLDREERRLLIDPCVDEPSEYLVFTGNGDVRAEPIEKFRRGWEGDRARVMIEVLGLNRLDLVRARTLPAFEFERHLRGDRDAPGWADHVRGRLADAAPFAALHRQIFARWVLGQVSPEPELLGWLEAACPRLLAAERERAEGSLVLLEPLEAEEPPPDVTVRSFSVEGVQEGVLGPEPIRRDAPEPEIDLEAEVDSTPVPEILKHAPSATIRRLRLENFKAIRKLGDVALPEGPAEPVSEHAGAEAPQIQLGWLSFLGENGAGKSSILQAIALTLAGPRIQGDDALGPPTRFIRRRDAADPAGGEIAAAVEIELSNLPEPLRLEITQDGFHFPNWQDPGVFVRAYGASRFPARHVPDAENSEQSADPEGPPPIEFHNLFDPFTPLVGVKKWLQGLAHDEIVRGAVRRALEDLLGLGPEPDAPEPSKLRLDVSPDGDLSVDDEPLENLSSGYQTLIALAADIMAGVPQRLSDMQDAGGIILLDEVGAHLHPGWKMVVVPRLRTAFPGMQFVTTTHEPLCLRGHTEGEVAVVSRKLVTRPHPETDGETVEIFDVQLATDLPSPQNLRVDQLLTSKHFGLDSTIDPELDASFRRYYQLLARHDTELEQPAIEERERLREQLRGQGILGYTRRDQLIYDAIDEYIALERRIEEEAREEEQTDERKKERRKAVMKDVIDLWRFAQRDEDEREGRP